MLQNALCISNINVFALTLLQLHVFKDKIKYLKTNVLNEFKTQNPYNMNSYSI